MWQYNAHKSTEANREESRWLATATLRMQGCNGLLRIRLGQGKGDGTNRGRGGASGARRYMQAAASARLCYAAHRSPPPRHSILATSVLVEPPPELTHACLRQSSGSRHATAYYGAMTRVLGGSSVRRALQAYLLRPTWPPSCGASLHSGLPHRSSNQFMASVRNSGSLMTNRLSSLLQALFVKFADPPK